MKTFELEVAGLRYTATFSRFAGGRSGEVFVRIKRGTAADAAVRDASILVSFCLQHGCPVETISRALSRNSDGSASGVMAAMLDRIEESGR